MDLWDRQRLVQAAVCVCYGVADMVYEAAQPFRFGLSRQPSGTLAYTHLGTVGGVWWWWWWSR